MHARSRRTRRRLLPKEGRFHELLGEISLAQKQPQDALPHYQKAIDLNSDYFGSYLGAGVAQFQAGNHAKAEEWLSKSAQLLPTAPAAYYLGTIARERGDRAKAMEYYRAAAGSQSRIGEMAAAEFIRMDLPQNPDNYVAAAGQFDGQGRLLVVVQNRAPVPLRDFQVTPVLVDACGPDRAAGLAGARRRGAEAGRAGRSVLGHRQHLAAAAAVSAIQGGRQARIAE